MNIRHKYATISGRFFSYKVNFKDFDDIDEQRVEEIKELVKEYKIKYDIDEITDSLEVYITTLSHLLSIHKISYDEKIIFLILVIDEDLQIFNKYLQTDFIKNKNIIACTDENEKKHQKELQKAQLEDYKNSIRESFGFYDNNLLSFESKYYKKFIKPKILTTQVGNDYSKTLLDDISNSKLDMITESEYNSVKEKAENYLAQIPSPCYKDLLYHITHQHYLLNLKNYREQYLFLILVLDPELKLLEIYNDEATWGYIEKRALDELGFFHKNIVILEKQLSKAF